MSLFAKIMVVVNFILAVAFLSAAGTLLGAAEDYKGKYQDTQKRMEKETADLRAQVTAETSKKTDAVARQAEADKARAAAETSMKTLSAANDQLAGVIASLKGDYEKLAAAQSDLQAKNSEKDKTIDSLRNENAQSEAGRREAEGKLKAANDDIARLTQDKETAEHNLDAANAQNNTLNKQVEDQKILLARYRNELGRVIPERIITRAPSAELRANQTDQDTLPPYDVLDAILEAYVEENASPAEIVARR